MHNGIYTLYQNNCTVLLVETNFHKYIQEQFLFVLQSNYFSAMQEVASVSQRLVLLKVTSPYPPLRRAEWVFWWSSRLRVVKSCWRKSSFNSGSKDSDYIQLITYLVKFSVFWIGNLTQAYVRMFCTYTWEHFFPHLHSTLPVGLIGIRARWLFKKSSFWDNNHKLQAAKRNFWELIIIFG